MDALLVIDAGNTHMKWGIYEGSTLRSHMRIPSHWTHSKVETCLHQLLDRSHHRPIRDAVISSVVPTLTPFLIDLCRKTFGCDPLIADANVETGISFPFDPENLGSDRRVNVTAGANKYGFPLIIVDLGTATTLDVVDDRGRYVGGVILPGIHTATEALILRTALLPRFSLERPESIIGQNTVAGLQAGALYGAAGQVDGLVRLIRREYPLPFQVVTTGGFADLIAPYTQSIHLVDRRLTLDGLRILWEKNRSGGTPR